MPLLTILTGSVFGLCLFWFTSLRISFFYSKEVKSIGDATHLLIKGKPGNVEVVKLYSSD